MITETVCADADTLTEVAAVLSNKNSLQILRLVFSVGYSISATIQRESGLHQSTVSKQLSSLVEVGLLKVESFKKLKIVSVNRARFLELGVDVNLWLNGGWWLFVIYRTTLHKLSRVLLIDGFNSLPGGLICEPFLNELFLITLQPTARCKRYPP